MTRMTQFLKDITIRRMILCTLLTISVLLAGQSAISVKGLQSPVKRSPPAMNS